MAKRIGTANRGEPSSPLRHHGQTDQPYQNGDAPLDAPDEGRYVTLEEYWADYYTHEDASYEWNDGYLEAKPLSTLAQYRLFLWFLRLLHEYILFYENAELMSLETGFTMTVPNAKKPTQLKKVVRKPDLAVILHSNAVQWGEHDHSYKGICDLCVESLSDSGIKAILRDTDIKKSEYAFVGVQEYYILDPAKKYMFFYERTANGDYREIQPDAEGVIHSKILPGFQFRSRDLDRLPLFEELLTDAVYYYVLPGYRAALDRAEQEQLRAEQERQRAEQERQRAEQARQQAEQERQRTEQARQQAEQSHQQAEQARQQAEQSHQQAQQAGQQAEQERQRAEQEQQRADYEHEQAVQERQRAERYAAQLRALGIDLEDL